MNSSPFTAVLVTLAVAAFAPSLLAQVEGRDPGTVRAVEQMLEEAYFLEVGNFDPAGALGIYTEILSRKRLSTATKARARLRAGVCCRRLGRSKDATRHFELVIKEHPDKRDAVRLAREYLGQGAISDPARFMPPNVLLYAEIVHPADHVRALSNLLEGTPFQNPVDYYLDELEASAPEIEAGDGDTNVPRIKSLPPGLREASAFLNEGFLRDLQGIEGLAISVPARPLTPNEFLLVVLPGTSNILPGVVQWILSMGKSPVVSTVKRMPVFRLDPLDRGTEDEPDDTDASRHLHAAVGDALGGEVLLLGSPRRLVEEAIERFAEGTVSLADHAAFRSIQKARPQTILFSYIDHEKLLDTAVADAPEEERGLLRSLRSELGWDRIEGLHLTISSPPGSGSLQVSLQGRLSTHDFDAWRLFHTPALSGHVLRAIPETSLGYCAVSLEGRASRMDALEQMVARLLQLAPPLQRDIFERESTTILKALNRPEAKALFGSLREVALALGSELVTPLPASLQVILDMHGTQNSQEIIEDAIGTLLFRIFQSPASRRFFTETLLLEGRELVVRAVEPFPGIRLRVLKLGSLHVLAFSDQLLLGAARAYEASDSRSAETLPTGATKIISVRPAAFLRSLGRVEPSSVAKELSEEWFLLLSEIDRVSFFTREMGHDFSAQLFLPRAATTVRSFLSKLPQLR